jgi:hypothetical protein
MIRAGLLGRNSTTHRSKIDRLLGTPFALLYLARRSHVRSRWRVRHLKSRDRLRRPLCPVLPDGTNN